MTPIEKESRNSLDVDEKFLEGKTNDHKERTVRLKPALVQALFDNIHSGMMRSVN